MEYVAIFLPLGILVIEWFLGSTNIVEPNSTISLILGGLKKVLEAIKPIFKKPSEDKK